MKWEAVATAPALTDRAFSWKGSGGAGATLPPKPSLTLGVTRAFVFLTSLIALFAMVFQ